MGKIKQASSPASGLKASGTGLQCALSSPEDEIHAEAVPALATPPRRVVHQYGSLSNNKSGPVSLVAKKPPPKSAKREERPSPTPNKGKIATEMKVTESARAKGTPRGGNATPTKRKGGNAETPVTLTTRATRSRGRGTPTLAASITDSPLPTSGKPTPGIGKRTRGTPTISKALTFGDDDNEDDDHPRKKRAPDISRDVFLQNEAQRRQKEARNFEFKGNSFAPINTRSGRVLGDVFVDGHTREESEAVDEYGGQVEEQVNPFEPEAPLIPDVPIIIDQPLDVSALSPSPPSVEIPEGRTATYLPFARPYIRLMLDILNSRNIDNNPTPFVKEDDNEALKGVVNLLSGTVERGEGNSCLVVGPRGSGKTRTIARALSLLPHKAGTRPIVVRLSGHAQTNDRLAIREMGRQIALAEGKSYDSDADGGDVDGDDEAFAPTTLPSHLLALLTAPSPRAIIIILEEFDLFTEHARQALLYCLFDVVQSVKTGPVESTPRGVAVLGVTTRVDTLLLLEKRVKSRFSHRVWRVTSPLAPRPTAESLAAIAERAEARAKEKAKGYKGYVIDDPPLVLEVLWQDVVRWALIPWKYGYPSATPEEGAVDFEDTFGEKGEESWKTEWECMVEELLKVPQVRRRIERLVDLTTDVRDLYRPFISPLAEILTATPFSNCISIEKLTTSVMAQVEGAGWGLQTDKLSGLPHPSLGVLVIAKHLAFAGREEFNFAMVEEEYLRFSREKLVGSGRVRWPIPILRSGYDHLISRSLLLPSMTSTAAGKQHHQFSKVRSALSPTEIVAWFKGAGKDVLSVELANWGRMIGGYV